MVNLASTFYNRSSRNDFQKYRFKKKKIINGISYVNRTCHCYDRALCKSNLNKNLHLYRVTNRRNARHPLQSSITFFFLKSHYYSISLHYNKVHPQKYVVNFADFEVTVLITF